MNFKKWPHWVTGGCMFLFPGIVTVIFLPEEVSNLAYTPWWAGWFVLPAFFIYSIICIIFGIDFISNIDSESHLALLNNLWAFSILIVFFGVGSLIGLVIGKVKLKKK